MTLQHRLLLTILALTYFLGSSTTAWAAEAEAGNRLLRGEVTSVAGDSVTLQTRRDKVRLLTDKDTVFDVPGIERATLDDLSIGDFVIVQARRAEDGAALARHVIVIPDGSLEDETLWGIVSAVNGATFELRIRRGKVTVVTDEAPDKWGEGLPNLNNYKLNVWFGQKGKDIEIIRHVQYKEITPKGLIVTTKEGEEQELNADSIIPVFPLRTDQDLCQTLQGKVSEVFAVGACNNPKALIVDAIAEASEVASSI